MFWLGGGGDTSHNVVEKMEVWEDHISVFLGVSDSVKGCL